MSKRQGLLFIGIFTFILPFLGVPTSWRTLLTVLIGAGLIAISYFMGKEDGAFGGGAKKTPSTFVESRNDTTSK